MLNGEIRLRIYLVGIRGKQYFICKTEFPVVITLLETLSLQHRNLSGCKAGDRRGTAREQG
jgi:hypothetical protein